jgi:hypothetical protein
MYGWLKHFINVTRRAGMAYQNISRIALTLSRRFVTNSKR